MVDILAGNLVLCHDGTRKLQAGTLQIGLGGPSGPSGIPEEGLLFYAPMTSDKVTTAETGQTLTFSDGVVPQEIDGISCLKFPNVRYYMTANEPSLIGKVLNATISMWMYIPSSIGAVYDTPHFLMLGLGTGAQYSFLFGTFNVSSNTVNFQTLAKSNTWPGSNAPVEREKWFHVCGTVDDGLRIRTYVDGVPSDELVQLDARITLDSRGSGDCIKVNRQSTDAEGIGNVAICALRIYDRVLDASEIAALAKEFTPTP